MHLACVCCNKIIDDYLNDEAKKELEEMAKDINQPNEYRGVICKECQANNFLLVCSKCGAMAVTNYQNDGNIMKEIAEKGALSVKDEDGNERLVTEEEAINTIYGINLSDCPNCNGNKNEITISGIISKEIFNKHLFK